MVVRMRDWQRMNVEKGKTLIRKSSVIDGRHGLLRAVQLLEIQYEIELTLKKNEFQRPSCSLLSSKLCCHVNI